ncbi:glycolipid 2-alpha-mannosyltransferase [Scheffersomyces amazonensis]|uniref:glycolipid 2-alpha-mannosyltransferase n=1 Tax=Scheffersomyces amazonensis TaxID=1078765 RepID=UPI00315C5600
MLKRGQIYRYIVVAVVIILLYSLSFILPSAPGFQSSQDVTISPKLQDLNSRIEEMKQISKAGPTPQHDLDELKKLEAAQALELRLQKEEASKAQLTPSKDINQDKRVKATFVTLARNSELKELIKAIRQVEDRFNHKFNYDWVFLNDVEFTQEFIDHTSAMTSGNTKYGLIPKEHWSYPDFIDLDKAAKARQKMKEEKIIYGDSESYRHMCRFESGFFWQNELLDEYDWYWRVEPGIQIYCDIDYDVFKFMEDNNKVYGFTISIHEFLATIPTLWEHTKKFIKENPQYIAEDNFMDFISNDGGESYNLCHFWSNFEIANLNFWRSEAYRKYFEYLDSTGGFFYERWGDAPVHSIAVSLFLPKEKIHYFHDVGYNHGVYHQCPLNTQFRYDHKCLCNPDNDFTFRGYSCGKQYYNVMGLEKPIEWSKYQ